MIIILWALIEFYYDRWVYFVVLKLYVTVQLVSAWVKWLEEPDVLADSTNYWIPYWPW